MLAAVSRLLAVPADDRPRDRRPTRTRFPPSSRALADAPPQSAPTEGRVVPRIPIRPFFAALILAATVAGALTWRADAVFAAQPHPAPAPQPVAAATAPAIGPRILAQPMAYLAPPP